ncbi:WEB family protein At1g12150, partial [Linum perenne]
DDVVGRCLEQLGGGVDNVVRGKLWKGNNKEKNHSRKGNPDMVNIRTIKPEGKTGGGGGTAEIDTRAPFQSVKAAVSLFGEVAISKSRPSFKKSNSRINSENVLEKETQLMLSRREFEKYRHQLESAETAKARTNAELDRAKRTLEDLNGKLNSVVRSKMSALEAAEAVKQRAKKLEVAKSQNDMGQSHRRLELQEARDRYAATSEELNSAKQELNKIRQDFDATLEAKWAAFQLAAEAQRSANMNTERAGELTKEIQAMRESGHHLKAASLEAQERQAKCMSDKTRHVEAYKAAKEEVEMHVEQLRKEYDPELVRVLEERLAETTAEIEDLQEQMKRAHASEMDSVKGITTELHQATRTLQAISEEESTLRVQVNNMRMQLENMKLEKAQLLEKEAQSQLLAQAEENAAFKQLISETEASMKEAEELERSAKELKQEAEDARLRAEQAEEKLVLANAEIEVAKAAALRAHNEMRKLSEMKDDILSEEPSKRMRISMTEYLALQKKLSESAGMAERTVADTMNQLEIIKAKTNEETKKMEANQKAIEEIKEATEIALQGANVAETAQHALQAELKKLREQAKA